MMQRADSLSIPMLAGSSLATCWRKPNLEYSKGEHELTEGCCLVNGGVSFGFGGDGWHAMEAVQCMVERRKGGESGVTTPHRFIPLFRAWYLVQEACWYAYERRDCSTDSSLFRSGHLTQSTKAL